MLIRDTPTWSGQLLELPEQPNNPDSSQAVVKVLERLEQQGWPKADPVIAGSLYLLGALINEGRLAPSRTSMN